jgi:Peptidase C39 family
MPCKFGHAHVHVKQVTGETCSTACVEMVCRRFGANLEYTGFQENFYKVFKREGVAGLTHEPIKSILTGLGFNCVVHALRENDSVGRLFRAGSFPIIAEVTYKLSATKSGVHWVVVDGRKANLIANDEFCILDPSKNELIYSSIPKKGLASYENEVGRQFLFSGRMIHVAQA